MRVLNTDWAIEQLDKFIVQTVMRTSSSSSGGAVVITARNYTAAPDAEVAKQAQVVERIFDRVIPDWRTEIENSKNNRWTRHREAAIRARAELVRAEEIWQNLGDDAPEISAANLHRSIWSGARSLWQSGHYVQAVRDAVTKLNAETQNKVGRRDVSETDLFKQSFSLDEAKPGKARLRRMPPEDRDTYRSVQRGAMAFAEGVFAGIRNPLSHEADQELTEQVALEYLAALSVLARWVDESVVEHAGGGS
ncbi:TIGR02391 family protein [Agromyces aerolatus]|uniref:TIGR02391 family protein n=1 Tax=Agromyces sp. LY-1074 TaxID=3074080 RepID=UPI002861196C|nr:MULTISPECIES: TIGR02391 family protein [unclassified Agromyces]MDR5700719.1 TIGR02391 family protein [Agromyces sp. LY-1074]MDR5707240.1 TIGR02391 family protein [Agromyces sp. LY-1358]